MDVTEVLEKARDAITVSRVYGEPYEKDGTSIIPAARVSGGGGGGSGKDDKGSDGSGGGFGVRGRPAGAYVIRHGDVTWRPAVDPNRIIGVVGLVLAAWLVSRPRVIRARARASR